MQRLIDSNLFGMGLIPITSPEMVERYNDCLDLLGIERTTLTSFNVDGIGWSPEIAREKKDRFYLSAGPANPMAIVVGPDQRDKPIYFPYNSYERSMMRRYFDSFPNQIADITARVFIGLDIDHELMLYNSPLDLLLVDYILLRTLSNGLTESASIQRALAAKILDTPDGWSNAAVRADLIESASQHGDMRYLQTEIPVMKYDHLGIFHTQAFDGAFAIRKIKHGDGLVILENETQVIKGDARSYGVHEDGLVDRLLTENILELNMKWYAENASILEDFQEFVLADALCETNPEMNYVKLNAAQKKRLIAKHSADIPEIYHELERVARRLNEGKSVPVNKLSDEMQTLLLRPHSRLLPDEQDVIWRLILRWSPLNILKCYECDKNFFFKTYMEWPESKKEWAVAFLKKRYVLTVKS